MTTTAISRYFSVSAFLFLLVEFLYPERKLKIALKKIWILFIVMSRTARCKNLAAQKEDALIQEHGNKLYKQQQYDESQKKYQQAIEKAPDDPVANYNLGNAQFRKSSFDDAVRSYQASVDHNTDKTTRESGFYNQGVALAKQKKLEESIAAWKDALKLDPKDQEARENLQKALLELKSKQQQQKKDDKQNQDKKQDKKDQQKQQQQPNQQQQQPPPQSRLTKKQVEQLLKALQQKENEAQDKMNQNKVKSLSQPDKDW